MIIILEGPDGGGKTTLANRLHDKGEYNFHYVHHGNYPDLDLIAPFYLESMLGKGNIILDRSWLSEPIYATAKNRGPSRVKAWERRMLERVAMSRTAIVINCLPSHEACVKVWKKRDGEYITNDAEYDFIYRRYYHLTASSLSILSYNYEADPQAKEVFEAVNELSKFTERGPGVGNFFPGSTLIVGDRNGGSDPGYGLPFIAWRGCSPWLSQQLELGGIHEHRLYWINAFSKEGRPTNPDFIFDYLEPKRIIALGHRALSWCLDHELDDNYPVTLAHHPQFWSRFHRHQPYPLIRMLNEGGY